MSAVDSAAQLQEQGSALLQGVFARNALIRLREAAHRCFEVVEAGRSQPERYRYNRSSHSLLLRALTDFGCDLEELTAPLAAPELASLFAEVVGGKWVCNMEQSWVRKKFAPHQAPCAGYHPQGWHQDGALGVHFPHESGPQPGLIPMTELLTCWIPLNACGRESPGLEFVRGCQPALLHFSALDDASVRRRFRPEEFWAPKLAFGDGLIFLNSVLHRTYTRAGMRNNRISVEYRLFPR